MDRFIISGFADEISDDLDEQIKGLKALNMEYMELRSINHVFAGNFTFAYARQVRKKLDSEGIKISSLASNVGKWSITDPFDEQLDMFRRDLDIARELGAPNMRIFSFYTDMVEDPLEYAGEVLDRLNEFKEENWDSGVVLLHENDKKCFGDTAEKCAFIARMLCSPDFKLIFDPGSFVKCDQETYPEAYEMLKPYISYLHINDSRLSDKLIVPSGQGDGHIRDILKDLKNSGFQGFLSLEPQLADYAGKPKAGFEEFKMAHRALMDIAESL